MQSIDETRRQRLLELISEAGSGRAAAERIGCSEAQLSQYKARSRHSQSGKPRSIGDDFARRAEAAFGKRRGWMDTPPNVTTVVMDAAIPLAAEFRASVRSPIPAALSSLRAPIEHASPAVREAIGQLLLSYARDPAAGEAIARAIEELIGPRQ